MNIDGTTPFQDTPDGDQWWSAAQRLDPFYGGFWGKSSGQSAWASHTQVANQVAGGRARWEAAWKLDPDEAMNVLLEPRYRETVVAALGAITQWRTLSGEQLASITGHKTFQRRFANHSDVSPVLRALWTVGALDAGRTMIGAWAGQPHHAPLLWRPRASKFWDKFAPNLSWAQQVAVTGGDKYRVGHQHDRHNVLSVELALRFAEFGESGTVLGEAFAGFDQLSDGRWTRLHELEGAKTPNAVGDVVLVRPDGLRIVVELTAGAGISYTSKLQRWAKFLANVPFAASGVVVVFVEALPPYAGPGQRKQLRWQLRNAMSNAVRAFPGRRGDLVEDRLFLASWDDWFPSARTLSNKFELLTANKVAGAGAKDWVSVDMASIFDLPLPDDSDPLLEKVIENSLGLAGTPKAIGDRHPTFDGLDFVTESLRALGVPPVLEVESGTDQGWVGQPLQVGRGVGVAGDVVRSPKNLFWAPFSQVGPPPVNRHVHL